MFTFGYHAVMIITSFLAFLLHVVIAYEPKSVLYVSLYKKYGQVFYIFVLLAVPPALLGAICVECTLRMLQKLYDGLEIFYMRNYTCFLGQENVTYTTVNMYFGS